MSSSESINATSLRDVTRLNTALPCMRGATLKSTVVLLLCLVLVEPEALAQDPNQPPPTSELRRHYGAKGDGEADDTVALERWLAGLQPGQRAYADAGTYRFVRPLHLSTATISLAGAGPYQTVFVYDGPTGAGDIFTVGDGH